MLFLFVCLNKLVIFLILGLWKVKVAHFLFSSLVLFFCVDCRICVFSLVMSCSGNLLLLAIVRIFCHSGRIMFCYTHHSDMDAPQYVHVDEPSDDEVAWMFYYKHHSHTYTPQCVHIDDPSDVEVVLNLLLHTSQRYGRSTVCTL